MKNAVFALLFSLFTLGIFAQDTIEVKTLNFSDITKRRGWYVFPKDTNRYEKILMYYTLKCDAATTQDQYACGEWDYTTYTNLYQHNNVGAPRYLVDGNYPDTINYVTNPTYTYFQNQQYFIVYDNTTSETDYSIGSGSTALTNTFNSGLANSKAQYLWTAAELSGSGISAGTIDKIKLDFSSLGSDLNYLTVRMKHTALSSLHDTLYETSGFTEVYHLNTQIPSTGINTLNLTTPFVWDGTSNLIVEFSFSNANPGTGHTLVGETTSFNSAVYATQDDGKLDFVWGDYVEVPASAFAAIDSFITVSFWCYGDTGKLPESTYIFEGRDANGNRVINSHLPWSNSEVYWDAGNSGTASYDRINQPANTMDFEGQWNHWAFTKDVSTGEMKIYLNGSLWLSGTGKTRTMSGITSFKIAGQANSYGKYDGAIHDFRIWNVALDSNTIQDWMYKDVTASHPNYANLQAYYKFDDMTGYTATDASASNADANLMGLPSWNYIKGWDQYRNMTVAMERPNISFTQGIYTTHLDSIMVLDSVMNAPKSIIQYSTSIDTNNSGITMAVIDTTYGWESGWVYTYDQYGNKVDSTYINYDNQLVNQYNQTTFQLQNYVTPYGIGLSLGPDGFRWVYDVTDYAPLFHDTVELSAGNQQELIDLRFIMIKGTPPRDVIKIESIWLGDYQHSDIANDFVMPAVNVDLDPTAASFRIKTRTSGHWFGGFQNCAEFCPKYHNVFVDGVKRFEWLNWKECADNPVIAQGGTWIYDRAGWCPGAFTDTYDHELTPYVTPGTTVSLDYGMEFTAGGMEGNYRTTMQLVTYTPNNFNLDARIDEIISPTDWEYHSKINPICTDPQIVIQNTGTTTLTSLTITYNVLGGTQETYNWTGSLAFMEREMVTLPIPGPSFWTTASQQNIFEVSISAPNGGMDEYAYNNNASSAFEKPDVYSGLFSLRIQTNNAGTENSYTIKDDQGNIVMQRATMANNTLYYDTLNLPDGCYVFELLDSDDDGMSFFANNDGNGTIRFWPTPLTWVKNFNAQFGKFLRYHFIIDNTVGIDSYDKMQEIEVFPNPSKGSFTINVTGFDNEQVTLAIYNTLGENFYSEQVQSVNGLINKRIDLSAIPNGIYYVRVFAKNNYAVQRIVKH
ncbi:MAG: T9SS type A sorting domain-containing protein [Flavobacteriales bacterium]|nr:T9SS type A sorting domain-containing protein [Flavobacteriales bacterium]